MQAAILWLWSFFLCTVQSSGSHPTGKIKQEVREQRSSLMQLTKINLPGDGALWKGKGSLEKQWPSSIQARTKLTVQTSETRNYLWACIYFLKQCLLEIQQNVLKEKTFLDKMMKRLMFLFLSVGILAFIGIKCFVLVIFWMCPWKLLCWKHNPCYNRAENGS